MNGHSLLGILTAEEICELEAEKAYWLNRRLEEERGISNDREKGTEGTGEAQSLSEAD